MHILTAAVVDPVLCVFIKATFLLGWHTPSNLLPFPVASKKKSKHKQKTAPDNIIF